MDNLRLVFWAAAVILVWITIQTWQLDYGPKPLPPAATATDTQADAAATPALPSLPQETANSPAPGTATPPAAVTATAAETPARTIAVRTDVLDVQINLHGGDLSQVRLPRYPVAKNQPDVPVQLIDSSPEHLFQFHTGLRADAGRPEANHFAEMRAERSEYVLEDGADELLVTLSWEVPGDVAVDKIYRFRRGSYDIGLEYRVRNLGASPYSAASYLQLQRLHNPPARTYFNVDSYSFTGPVFYDGTKKQKYQLDELREQPIHQQASHGWIASIQHHFLAAAVPPADQTYSYDLTTTKDVYSLSAIGPLVTIAPGAEASLTAQLFVGPKLQAQLEEVAAGLKLTVDYGALTILAQPLFWLLQKIHDVVGNWGWAIIIATFLIKLAFYKLTETSGRSMARMRQLQPRMAALQERYKDDRQQLSQKMMDLYKSEKVNPAAGCLPMLIQVPFFIAFYWVLLESVEMRQAPFALWISDLSTRDPYFVLPLLMAVAMWVQGALNPPPPDPFQAKVMKIMPVAFSGLFAFFPAGLVLYWLTNSVLSVAQQWRINKVLAVG